MRSVRYALLFLFCMVGLESATAEATGIVAKSSAADLHVEIVSHERVRGSGFFVERGLLVTSAHVLSDRTPGATVTLRRSDGRRTTGRVVGVSQRFDVAAIVAADAFRQSPVRPVRLARDAMAVSAAGSRHGALALSQGVVTSAASEIPPYGPGFIAAMPGVGPGFSGGPVVDDAGALVGMVAAYRKSLRSPSIGGSAFAPVNASKTAQRLEHHTDAFVIHAVDVRTEALLLRNSSTVSAAALVE